MSARSAVPPLFCRYAFEADRKELFADDAGSSAPIPPEKSRGTLRPPEAGSDASPTPGRVAAMTPEQFNVRLRRILPLRGDRFAGDLLDTCMVIERSKNLNVVVCTVNLLDPHSREPLPTGKGHKAVINDADPLRTYWIKLEPEHVARRRARGQMEDICELNYIEKKLAYGCSASRSPEDKVVHELNSALKKTPKPLTAAEKETVKAWDEYFCPCHAKYVAAPHWPVFMLMLPPLPADEQASNADTAPAGASPAAADSVPVMLAMIDGKLSILTKVYVTSIEPKHFYQLPTVESLEAFGVSVDTGAPTYEKRMNK